ncbi:Aste57867_24570 [Aphanomyces stellatus]|uniref:Aste57867_24570 protein n=1 Tax=Aphanomyces stellatus TaxID=120398 RepID=A0A485LQT8_9STRA|nr:hypothetical protein As57867_024492 [Aphanomyces stellatus]VFU01209.1 Aste57867_24570 [Aphanomyces stellatus]
MEGGKTRGRPNIQGTHAVGTALKHKQCDYRSRYIVILHYRSYGMDSALDVYYRGLEGVERESTRKKILRWARDEAKIKRLALKYSTSKLIRQRDRGIGTVLPEEAEANLANWVSQLRQDGIPVSLSLLAMKARSIATDLNIDPKKFKATHHWVRGFIKRHKFAFRARTRSGQMRDDEGEAVLLEFSERLKKLVESENIERIYNADQTAVNYEFVPKTTLDTVGKKTIWIKCAGQDKARATAMLLGDSLGTKYPLFIVMKAPESKVKEVVQANLRLRNGFGAEVWEEIEELHERHPSRIYGNPSAWWNSKISMEFLAYHFGHRRGKDLPKILLLWDAFSAHFTSEVVALANELNVVLEKVPPRYTWICQPADVSWMKPFKSILRKSWFEYLMNEINTNRGQEFKLKPPSRFDVVDWINEAWDKLPAKTIVSGFAKCKLVDAPNTEVPSECSVTPVDFNLVADALLETNVGEILPDSDIESFII